MRFYFIAAAVMASFFGISAHDAKAATLTLTSVTGLWHDVQGGANVSIVPPGGGDPTTLSWGNTIQSGDSRSSYVFDGLPGAYDVGVDFTLGTFTHNNFPIPSGSGITGTQLTANFVGNIDGTPFNVSSLYQFTHNETPNTGGGCCNDIVTAITNPGGSVPVLISGVEYIFAFTGFKVGDDVFTQFSTVENASNVAQLQGVLIEKSLVPPVPLPAALPLFAGGLGLLGLLSRRRKRETVV
jgi:hypothetical protein